MEGTRKRARRNDEGNATIVVEGWSDRPHDSSCAARCFAFKDLSLPSCHAPLTFSPPPPLQNDPHTTNKLSQLPADATLQHLRAAVAKQHSTGGGGAAAAAAAGTFLRDGAPLAGAPAASLSSLGVGSGDLLVCVPDPQGGSAAAATAAPSVSAADGGIPDAAAALAALRADPAAVAALPLPLQEAVRTGDLETLGAAMR